MDRTNQILVLCFLVSLASVAFSACPEETYQGILWVETAAGSNGTNAYACGALATGAYYRYCHENSTWDDEVIPVCVDRTCEESVYGPITFPETVVNSTAVVDCGPGFIGNMSRFCSVAGQWGDVVGSCTAVCNATLDNGIMWPQTEAGETVYMNCSIGYTGQVSRQCVDGQWGEVQGSCSIVVCQSFTDDMGRLWPAANFNETSSLPCGEGMDGYMNRTCQADGTFGDMVDTCTTHVDRCPEESLEGILWPQTDAGMMASQPCMSGYEGTASRYCGSGGIWNAPDTAGCVPVMEGCAAESLNGINWPTTAVNATATMPCRSGFTGQATRVCFDGGVWGEPDTSNCVEEVVFCPANTDYDISWPQTNPGESVEMPCDEGFTGTIVRTCGSTGRWGNPVYNCVEAPESSSNAALIIVIVVVVLVVLVVLVFVILNAGSGVHYNAKRAQRKMVELAYV